MSEPILYQTEDGTAEVRLRAEQGSVRLTQGEIAELVRDHQAEWQPACQEHSGRGELVEGATVKESLTVQIEGGRQATAGAFP